MPTGPSFAILAGDREATDQMIELMKRSTEELRHASSESRMRIAESREALQRTSSAKLVSSAPSSQSTVQ